MHACMRVAGVAGTRMRFFFLSNDHDVAAAISEDESQGTASRIVRALGDCSSMPKGCHHASAHVVRPCRRNLHPGMPNTFAAET